MIYDVEVCEDEDALQQLEKSVNSSYSLFTSMVLHKHTTSTLSAAIPKGSAPETKNRGPETFLFHQTKDTEEKYQVGKTKQGREDGDDWELEEWWAIRAEQQQNICRLHIRQNDGAQGMWCFIVWNVFLPRLSHLSHLTICLFLL